MTRIICLLVAISPLLGNLYSQQNVNVQFADLEAGQYNVGFPAVEQYTLPDFETLYLTGYYKGTWYGPGPDGLNAYEVAKAPPAILGPSGVEHLLDNHHRTTALCLLSQMYTNSSVVVVTNPLGVVSTNTIGPAPTTVWVNQTQDWSTMNITNFWAAMQLGNTDGVTNFSTNNFINSTNQPTYVWTYNDGVPVTNLIDTPPPMITGLTDDTLRGIAGTLSRAQSNSFGVADAGYLERDAGGQVLYYQEFYWANYLRPLIYWDTTNAISGMDSNAPNQFTNYDQMCLFAAQLCHDAAASALPGYLSAVPEPQPTLLILLGLTFIVVISKTQLGQKISSSILRKK